jgi:hypothetical protein
MKKFSRLAASWGAVGAVPACAIEACTSARGPHRDRRQAGRRAPGNAPAARPFLGDLPQAEVEPRVRTEARYAYDHQALYVAVRAWDPDVGQLRAPFARRDKVLADQDHDRSLHRPVGNRKFAHFFRVNPRDAVGDGLFNEDSGARTSRPTSTFEVVTGRFEGCWTAEFRIPLQGAAATPIPRRSSGARWCSATTRATSATASRRRSCRATRNCSSCTERAAQPRLDALPEARNPRDHARAHGSQRGNP